MDLLSPAHLILIFLIVVLLFGGRKIPEVMKGLGEGIRSFKDGMAGNTAQTPPPAQAPPPAAPAQPPSEEKKS
jgi:sec-independent protein translocase protein TatA